MRALFAKVQPDRQHYIDDDHDILDAAAFVSAGGVLAHAFANFYAISTRPGGPDVLRVNRMKGRPDNQVGSVLTIRPHMDALFDWDRFTAAEAGRIRRLIDTLFELGPFGFRGPAAAHLPAHLTSPSPEGPLVQLIAPGYRCPSNRLLRTVIARLDIDYLYVTSANRSHHLTGAEDEPAHFAADPLEAEFGAEPGFALLRHRDEAAARARYPRFGPMSTTVLGFAADRDGAARLSVERHGSLPLQLLLPILADHGFDAAIGPKATKRLGQRVYA